MKYGELIDQSIECIKTFNPVYSTVDSPRRHFPPNRKSYLPDSLHF